MYNTEEKGGALLWIIIIIIIAIGGYLVMRGGDEAPVEENHMEESHDHMEGDDHSDDAMEGEAMMEKKDGEAMEGEAMMEEKDGEAMMEAETSTETQ